MTEDPVPSDVRVIEELVEFDAFAPEYQPRGTGDEPAFQESPVTAIFAYIAVVTHNEILIWRDFYGTEPISVKELAGRTAVCRIDNPVWFVPRIHANDVYRILCHAVVMDNLGREGWAGVGNAVVLKALGVFLAVHIHYLVAHFHSVPGHADNPLHHILAGIITDMESSEGELGKRVSLIDIDGVEYVYEVCLATFVLGSAFLQLGVAEGNDVPLFGVGEVVFQLVGDQIVPHQQGLFHGGRGNQEVLKGIVADNHRHNEGKENCLHPIL